ncbi:MAG: nucleotide exchange factor GrpE [Acaryochloridaceae cyanobacterium RL_2_7]|nr:nucleotide exchange factor GrpE [Acaryochloridaceae cyanobacterium RL_2_7]
MTEESTPLETSANADIPLDESVDTDTNVLGEEAPAQETILDLEQGEDAASSDVDASEQHDSASNGDTESSLRLKLDDLNGQYMRLAADFDNFRKRTSKEKIEFEERAKRQTIIELLPVIDNFERARSQIKPQSDAENNIQKSYQGIYKQLVDCLKQLGVSPMRPEGEDFDPNLHEAVMREPTSEHPEGTVIEELRRGYLLGEQVLRHAMVKVAASPENDSALEESHDDQDTASQEG